MSEIITTETPVTPEPAPAAAPETVDATPAPTAEPIAAEPEIKTVPLDALKAERKKRHDLEIELAYHRGRAESGPAKQPEPVPAPKELQEPVKPTSDQFDSWEDFEAAERQYNRANLQYTLAMATETAKQTIQRENAMASAQRKAEKQIQAFKERLDKAAEIDPELTDIVNTWHIPSSPHHMALTPVMTEAIKESEVGPELVRYLADDKKEVARIAGMTPVNAARALGKIEASIQAKNVSKPANRISMAPDPITPIRPNGMVKTFDPDTASMEDFYSHYLEEMRTQRR